MIWAVRLFGTGTNLLLLVVVITISKLLTPTIVLICSVLK